MAKSLVPNTRTTSHESDEYLRLRLGIYEGIVDKEELRRSKVSDLSYKIVRIRLDNGRRIWSPIYPFRTEYDYLHQRVTVDARHEEWWRDNFYIRYYVYLGKWDDYGAY